MIGQLSVPGLCDNCGHLTVEHSLEPGVGCLHRGGNRRTDCPCTGTGESAADQ